MEVLLLKTGETKKIVVEKLEDSDFKNITKSRYHFNWEEQKTNDIYKLRLIESDEIL